jgi:hypothetical protein
MSPTQFLQLPLGVRIVVAVLIWPAVWAGASLAVALVGDALRMSKSPDRSRAPAMAPLPDGRTR